MICSMVMCCVIWDGVLCEMQFALASSGGAVSVFDAHHRPMHLIYMKFHIKFPLSFANLYTVCVLSVLKCSVVIIPKINNPVIYSLPVSFLISFAQ